MGGVMGKMSLSISGGGQEDGLGQDHLAVPEVADHLLAPAAQQEDLMPAAREWMANNFPHEHQILSPVLSAGNCHGLTFGDGGGQSIPLNEINSLLILLGWKGDWVNDESADILIALKGRVIGHSARKHGQLWRQTLPGGPIFLSTKEVLDYGRVLDLSVLEDRQALAELISGDQAVFDEALAAFKVAAAQNKHQDLAHDLAAWGPQADEMAPTAENAEQLRDWIQTVKDLNGLD